MRAESCVSTLALDRMLAGEEVAAVVRAHVGECAQCAARAKSLEDERRDFGAQVWIAGDVAKVIRAAPPERRAVVRGWSASVLASLAIAASLLLVLRQPLAPDTRAKGGPGLSVFVRHAGAVESALAGDAVSAGDELRFEVDAPHGGWVGVVGLDASPHATLYLPAARGLLRVPPGRHLLEGSIVRDAAPGAEREVALICAADHDAKEIEAAGAAALAGGRGDPARVESLHIAGCREASLLLRKAER